MPSISLVQCVNLLIRAQVLYLEMVKTETAIEISTLNAYHKRKYDTFLCFHKFMAFKARELLYCVIVSQVIPFHLTKSSQKNSLSLTEAQVVFTKSTSCRKAFHLDLKPLRGGKSTTLFFPRAKYLLVNSECLTFCSSQECGSSIKVLILLSSPKLKNTALFIYITVFIFRKYLFTVQK